MGLRSMRPSPDPSFDAPHEVGSHLSGAQHKQEASSAQDVAISAEEDDHRPAEPSLVRRYHLHPYAAWLPVPGCNHGLVQPQGSGVALDHYPRTNGGQDLAPTVWTPTSAWRL